MSEFAENLAYLRIFKNDIPHERVLDFLINQKNDNKNDLLEIKSFMNLSIDLSYEEKVIRKAFTSFINQHINNSHKNNHYFMNAKLKNLIKRGYKCINLSDCYEKLKKNKSPKEIYRTIRKTDEYIINNIIELKQGGNKVPQTYFMADFTEKKLMVEKTEKKFSEISRKDNFENLTKKEHKYICRYLTLSVVRNPEYLLRCFELFSKYGININKLDNMTTYDYYVIKFIYHIIIYSHYFILLKDITSNYIIKKIESKTDLICSDNETVEFNDEKTGNVNYILFNDAKTLLYFHSKKQTILEDRDSLINKYESTSIFFPTECIFFPSQYTLSFIKEIMLKAKILFRHNLFYAIAPHKVWNAKKNGKNLIDCYKKINRGYLKNNYFIKRIKNLSESKELLLKKNTTKLNIEQEINGTNKMWKLLEIIDIKPDFEVWRVEDRGKVLYLCLCYNKQYFNKIFSNKIDYCLDQNWFIYEYNLVEMRLKFLYGISF